MCSPRAHEACRPSDTEWALTASASWGLLPFSVVLAARTHAEGRSALGAAFEAAVERGRNLFPAAAVGYAAGEEG
jgi:hypothetical protein